MYANVDDFDPLAPQVPVAERPEIDRWILSELNTLVKETTAAYNDYEPCPCRQCQVPNRE